MQKVWEVCAYPFFHFSLLNPDWATISADSVLGLSHFHVDLRLTQVAQDKSRGSSTSSPVAQVIKWWQKVWEAFWHKQVAQKMKGITGEETWSVYVLSFNPLPQASGIQAKYGANAFLVGYSPLLKMDHVSTLMNFVKVKGAYCLISKYRQCLGQSSNCHWQ